MEVVCPWSNTGSTFVESMDEDGDVASTSEPDGARTNGHAEPQSTVQVGPAPAAHLAGFASSCQSDSAACFWCVLTDCS